MPGKKVQYTSPEDAKRYLHVCGEKVQCTSSEEASKGSYVCGKKVQCTSWEMLDMALKLLMYPVRKFGTLLVILRINIAQHFMQSDRSDRSI